MSLVDLRKCFSQVWPRKYAHSSFSSLVQYLLPKDTLLRTYLISLQLATGTAWRRLNVMIITLTITSNVGNKSNVHTFINSNERAQQLSFLSKETKFLLMLLSENALY